MMFETIIEDCFNGKASLIRSHIVSTESAIIYHLAIQNMMLLSLFGGKWRAVFGSRYRPYCWLIVAIGGCLRLVHHMGCCMNWQILGQALVQFRCIWEGGLGGSSGGLEILRKIGYEKLTHFSIWKCTISRIFHFGRPETLFGSLWNVILRGWLGGWCVGRQRET